MTKPFQPVRSDGVPYWRIIFDLAKNAEPGTVITYDELLTALDTDSKATVYRAVARADRELWTVFRALGAVKNVGYRLLRADEHEPRALAIRRQARRKMSTAVRVADATDLALLDDTQRAWMVKVQSGLHMLAGAMDDHTRRLTKHDQIIDKLTRRVERLEGQDDSGS